MNYDIYRLLVPYSFQLTPKGGEKVEETFYIEHILDIYRGALQKLQHTYSLLFILHCKTSHRFMRICLRGRGYIYSIAIYSNSPQHKWFGIIKNGENVSSRFPLWLYLSFDDNKCTNLVCTLTITTQILLDPSYYYHLYEDILLNLLDNVNTLKSQRCR